MHPLRKGFEMIDVGSYESLQKWQREVERLANNKRNVKKTEVMSLCERETNESKKCAQNNVE